ncbi:hypothetical protein ACTFIR_000154 [Dictyostelium discoideum]
MGELEREKSIVIIQKWVRGWLVRKQHLEFFKKIKIRKFVINEIIGFEKTYISKITYLLENLKIPLLQNTNISHDKVNNIFSNIEEIRELHITIYNKLIETKPLIITELYLEMLPKFTIYYPYVKNYNNAYKIYSTLSEEDEEFAQLAESFGYLPSFLILPVQQTPRYLLLFSELAKNTNIQNSDYKNMQKLIETIRETAKEINDCITSNENDDDDNSTFSNSSSGSSNKSNNSNSIKRPASASSKRKPRNSIAMHKKAIDAVLSDGAGNNNDYSHLPSYLRPTQASSAWSRSKVELSPSPKWRFSQTVQDRQYVYDNPLPTGISPYSELFSENKLHTPKKQSTTSSQQNQPWKPPSKSTTSIQDNCHKITKNTTFRPISPPPPKPNFYTVNNSNNNNNNNNSNNNNNNNTNNNNSMNSSSSSISSIGSVNSGISNGSNGGSSGGSTPLKPTNYPLQSITNTEIQLSPSSSLKPPLSPLRHSSPFSEKVLIEKLSINSSTTATTAIATNATATTTTTTTSHHQHTIEQPQQHFHQQIKSTTTTTTTATTTSSASTTSTAPTNLITRPVKKSLSSTNLFNNQNYSPSGSSSSHSSRTTSPINTNITSHSSTNNNNSNNNINNSNNGDKSEKTIPLSVVVSQ